MNTQPALRLVLLLAAVFSLGACGGAAERKAKYLEQGRAFYMQGNIEKAQIELKNALQIDPKDAEARYYMGLIQERRQDYTAAVANYRATIEFSPSHVPALVRLGRIYILGGAADRATEMVEAALKLQPADPDVLALRAAIRLNRGNTADAMTDAQAVLQQKPAHPDAVSLLVGIYSRNGQHDKAVRLLNDALAQDNRSVSFRALLAEIHDKSGQRQQAIEQYREIIRTEPEKLEHRIRLASYFVQHKQAKEAEQELREAVAKNPESAEPKMALVDFLAAQRSQDSALAALQQYIAEDRKAYGLRFGLARMQLVRGEVDKAAETYQGLIDDLGTVPQGLEARTQLARLRHAQGKVADAENLISEVLDRNGRDNDALLLRGNIALGRRDPVAAIADFRSVLKDQPRSSQVLRLLGIAHGQNNEPQLAIDNLKKAIEISPEDNDARLQLGQVLLQSRDIDGARKEFQAVLKRDAKHLAALESLYRVSVLKQDFATAADLAQRVRNAYPDVGLGYYMAGMLQQERKNFAASLGDFEAALKKSPRSAEALTGLVASHIALKQPDKAIARLQQSITATPDMAAAHNLLGEVEMLRQNTAPAIAAFEKAVEIIPQDLGFVRNLANAHVVAKKPEDAERVLKKALTVAQADPALHLELATHYQRLNRNDDAIEQYEAMLKRRPNSQVAANNLSMLLVSFRDDKKSLARAATLADRLTGSENPAFLDTVGWVRFKQGQYDGAIQTLEKAMARAPKEPLLRYHLGMAYFMKGDHQRASEHLKKAVDSNTVFHGREDAQSTLSRLRSS